MGKSRLLWSTVLCVGRHFSGRASMPCRGLKNADTTLMLGCWIFPDAIVGPRANVLRDWHDRICSFPMCVQPDRAKILCFSEVVCMGLGHCWTQSQRIAQLARSHLQLSNVCLSCTSD